MAEVKIGARNYLVWYNAGSSGSPSWLPIACATSHKFNSQLDTIDADSKCGDDQAPGDSFKQTIDIDGFSLTVAASPTKVSESKLYELHVAKTVFQCKIAPVSPTAAEDYIYTDDVWVSALSHDASDKDKVKFSATLTVQTGPMVKTAAP